MSSVLSADLPVLSADLPALRALDLTHVSHAKATVAFCLLAQPLLLPALCDLRLSDDAPGPVDGSWEARVARARRDAGAAAIRMSEAPLTGWLYE